jgi:hypothetical protein
MVVGVFQKDLELPFARSLALLTESFDLLQLLSCLADVGGNDGPIQSGHLAVSLRATAAYGSVTLALCCTANWVQNQCAAAFSTEPAPPSWQAEGRVSLNALLASQFMAGAP